MEQLILQFMIRAIQQKKENAYHLYGTSGNSEENSNGTVHPLEMFSAKKVIPSEVSDFPLLPERPKFLEPFAWITSARLSLERRTKIYLYFVNDTTQSCFRCENNTRSI